MIYTSGSTGRPKGSMLSHRGLCNLAKAQGEAFSITPLSKVLQFSSMSFDAFVWETVMALLNGAALCLVGRDIIGNIDDLVGVMEADRVTTVTLPPSVLAVFRESPLLELRTIITAGEKCPGELVRRWAHGRSFFNAYGPTETTVCASMHLCSGTYPDGPPIGRPLQNFRLYILDRNLQPVPVGVPGELHIGGVGLARGYFNRPDLTAEKFIPDPFGKERGSRLYKTGDLCRYLPDGNVEFLGRIDHQVKIRGFRIELGEIEAALRDFPGVKDVVTIAREDLPGDKRLAAYVVADATAAGSVAEMRAFLRTRLPEFMVPSAFVVLDALPMTPSNKVDRKALPAPEWARRDQETKYVEPRSETEKVLAEITSTLLHVPMVGVYDNFFDLGGHSLLATQFISRVRDALNIEIPLRSLFEHPTIAELAEAIDILRASPQESMAPAIRRFDRESARVKRSEIMQHP
jgi:acyl-coenzyme A synthetase/AMP-(fatty) acid ligase/acyl carrier protein